MSQFEEDRKQKEELEKKELADTVVLDDYYLSSRDLVGKGKDVHPTGKQRWTVQTIAQNLKFNQINRRKSTGTFGLETIKEVEEDGSAAYFDLNAKPRIFISSGAISKLEPGEKRHEDLYCIIVVHIVSGGAARPCFKIALRFLQKLYLLHEYTHYNPHLPH